MPPGPVPPTPLAPEAFLAGALAGGLLLIVVIYVLSTVFQALFIQMGLRWVSRQPVTLGSAFVTALCINIVGFLVSTGVAAASDNQSLSGAAGLALSIIVGTVLISKRHDVKLTDGLLVELISIGLSILMSIAAIVCLGVLGFLIFMAMR